MKVIELLASQLDREALPHEIQAMQRIFSEGLEFWQLCLEAKRLLIDEQIAKDEKCSPSLLTKLNTGVSK